MSHRHADGSEEMHPRMKLEELEKLERKCITAAIKRKDIRTVKALVILAMLRPPPKPKQAGKEQG